MCNKAKKACVPGVEAVDLTRSQHDFLTRLAIHHLQFERLDLLLKHIDLLDELLRDFVLLKCCPTTRSALLLEPRKLILDRVAASEARRRPGYPCPPP